MELSLFLAQLFGLTIMIFTVLALLQPKVVSEAVRSMQPYSFSVLVAGFIGVIAGLALILSHNIWEWGWRGVITLFGWAALVKGISYLIFPNLLIRTANSLLLGKRRTLFLSIAFLLGAYLAYQGFMLGS